MFDSANYTAAQGNNSTSTATAQSNTTAKQTARGIRVWLENKQKLESVGFYAGSRYSVGSTVNGIMLIQCDDGEARVSSCKRNEVVRPIIDLHSKALASIFTAGAVLEVTYTDGAITIKAI